MHVFLHSDIILMASFLTRYWKTLATTSVSLASSYLYAHYDRSQSNDRLLSMLTVHAAEYERRKAGKGVSKSRPIAASKKITDDDDDDEEEEEEDKDDEKSTEENITSARGRRFRDFASLEYNGEIYMTPVDFLESLVAERPRPRIGRRQLTEKMLESMLYNTPPKHRGSKRFFRQLEDGGLISFSEYLFLWVVLTKPSKELEIAFAMFDIDGNQLVDRREFLMLEKVMGDKHMLHRPKPSRFAPKSLDGSTKNPLIRDDKAERTNTTLLLHLFGKNGRGTLNYTEFHRFMQNFQKEVLEIEFSEFSHGFKTISDLDFAEILLRYTDLDQDRKKLILKKVKKTSDALNAITFEQFEHFCSFLNSLEEFSIAMRFHQLSNKPISQAEFQRAARISTGFELETHIIGLLFRIFDADDDQHLSYDEFMAVMKDRLSRAFQTTDSNDASISKFDRFKRCFRERARSAIIDEQNRLNLWKNEVFL